MWVCWILSIGRPEEQNCDYPEKEEIPARRPQLQLPQELQPALPVGQPYRFLTFPGSPHSHIASSM